jgi:hypothetical protein
MATSGGQRTTRGLWGALQTFAVLFMAAGLVVATLHGWRLWALQGLSPDATVNGGGGLEEFLPVEWVPVYAIALLVLLATYVVAAILTLIWYQRSVRNARSLVRGVRTTPAWAVAFFFIPVLSLIKPYAVTSELWRSSKSPDRWLGQPDPAALRWWWGLVLIGGLASATARYLEVPGATVASLIMADATMILSLALHILAGVLFLQIGGAITRAQNGLIDSGYAPPPSDLPRWAA